MCVLVHFCVLWLCRVFRSGAPVHARNTHQHFNPHTLTSCAKERTRSLPTPCPYPSRQQTLHPHTHKHTHTHAPLLPSPSPLTLRTHKHTHTHTHKHTHTHELQLPETRKCELLWYLVRYLNRQRIVDAEWAQLCIR